MRRVFVAGTDTDVGKTLVSAWLVSRWKAHYWKPIQSGSLVDSDDEAVIRWSGCSRAQVLSGRYRLEQPLSPHLAARSMGLRISLGNLDCPQVAGPLVVEGAGGLLVPLNEKFFLLDLIVQLGLPVLLVARSGLGTINHTLLSLNALRQENVSIAGVILSGALNCDNRRAIEEYGNVSVLAEVPLLDTSTSAERLFNPIKIRGDL